jgi:hypothetical protein
MSKSSGPIFSRATVAALLLSASGVCLRIDSARADNSCFAAPKASAPQGQHWYYHFDRQKGRKCWYLHTTVRLLRHAAPRPVSHPAVPAETTNADPAVLVKTPEPMPPASAPAPASSSAGTPTEPHVTILAVKTISEPGASNAGTNRVTREPAQQTAPQSANTPPMPQSESPAAGIPSAAIPSAAVPSTAIPSADTSAQPTTRVAGLLPDAGSPAKQTNSPQPAQMSEMPKPPEMLLLLALALGIMTFLIGVVSKIVARRRTPIISEDPDAAWHERFGRQPIDSQERYEGSYNGRHIPYVDPRGHRLADLHRQQQADGPPRRRAAAPGENMDFPPARPSQPSIEPALRVLRQARQRRTA